MKNTFNFIISFVAFAITALVTGSAVSAQNLADGTYMEQNGIAFAKRSTLNPDGTYTVDLETFVTGEVTQTYEAVPVDVVLVLDLSGSMDDKISSVSYEPASVSTISGNQGPTSYGSVNYPWETVFYYKYEGGYYLVSVGRQRGSGWNYNTYYYYLSFQAGGRTYYINTSGDVVTSRPDNVTSASINLLNSSVQLYSRVVTTSDKTKMEALQTAVKAFIDQIAHNDLYEDDTDSKPRSQALGNQISIVKFGSATYNGSTTVATTDPGNHFYHLAWEYRGGMWGGGWTQTVEEYTTYYNPPVDTDNLQEIYYNCTEVLDGFTPTAIATNVQALKDDVDDFISSGATAADYGMNLAYLLINGLGEDRANSSKTVVFFTDGAPTHGSTFDSTVASDAITNSNSIKAITYGSGTDATHPTVYSVGIFSGEITTEITNFMNNVATDSNHYINASGGSAEDLKNIFTEIAHNAGGSGNTSVSGGSSLTVDIVSSSFSVPTNFQSASDVVEVLVAPCNGVTEIDGVEYLTFGAEDTPQNCGLPAITPSISVADNKVSTTGFDYSTNWCGPDPTSATRYHGYKQIIRFVITLKDDAVGGPAVETNEPGSGIYLPNSTEPLITFNRPTVKIPVQIWIQKDGLQGNDTAVFNLRRTPFADFDPDHPEDAVWEDDWGTKIVIGPDDLDPVTGYCIKKQVGLDPDYYYMIKEDAWAFGYTYQLGGKQYTYGDNAHNPFTFTNIPNNKKFDEAQVRNVFYAKPQPTTPPSTGTDSK